MREGETQVMFHLHSTSSQAGVLARVINMCRLPIVFQDVYECCFLTETNYALLCPCCGRTSISYKGGRQSVEGGLKALCNIKAAAAIGPATNPMITRIK